MIFSQFEINDVCACLNSILICKFISLSKIGIIIAFSFSRPLLSPDGRLFLAANVHPEAIVKSLITGIDDFHHSVVPGRAIKQINRQIDKLDRTYRIT